MPSFSMLSVATLALFLTAVNGHSWIEQLTVVAPNGTFVGAPGFARGNVLRSSPGFGDPLMVNLLPPNGRANEILPTDLMCKSSQQTQTQTDGSPRLQAAPGATIALRYQENGHVTLPQNQPGKPEKGGNMYVYGTTDPQPSDNLLGIHNQWNADGSGGDKRGRLLSVSTYDDGRCYQVNGGQISTQRQKQFAHTANQLMGGDIWCQQDLALPSDAATGKPYTLYWVWDWPTAPNVDPGLPKGKAEIYTTCMDIDVVDTCCVDSGFTNGSQSQSQNQSQTTKDSYVQNQDLNYAAIPDQMAKLGQIQEEPAPSSDSTGAAPTTFATPTTLLTSSIRMSSSNSVFDQSSTVSSLETLSNPTISAFSIPVGSSASNRPSGMVTVTVTEFVRPTGK